MNTLVFKKTALPRCFQLKKSYFLPSPVAFSQPTTGPTCLTDLRSSTNPTLIIIIMILSSATSLSIPKLSFFFFFLTPSLSFTPPVPEIKDYLLNLPRVYNLRLSFWLLENRLLLDAFFFLFFFFERHSRKSRSRLRPFFFYFSNCLIMKSVLSWVILFVSSNVIFLTVFVSLIGKKKTLPSC